MPRHLLLRWLLLVLLLAGGEAAGAAGDDTSSAAGEAGPAAPSPLALPGPAVSAGSPAAGSPPKALPALPTPLGPVERALRFPLGDPARARQLNNQGLQLQQRRLPGARESYQAAVLASAAYPWARFNLAGELAREGKLDGALEQLESLYLLGTVEAARALLQAEAAPELRSLWADPRLAPLLDALADKVPLEPDRAEKPGCHGWSVVDGTVACTWHCARAEWPPAGGILLYRRGAVPEELAVHWAEVLGEEQARQARQEVVAELRSRRIPSRPIPFWPLLPDRPVTLDRGYFAHWVKTGQTGGQGRQEQLVHVQGPRGKSTVRLGRDSLRGCDQPVPLETPRWLRAYLVQRLGLVVIFAEFVGSCCDEQVLDNESWSAMAFVHPGER